MQDIPTENERAMCEMMAMNGAGGKQCCYWCGVENEAETRMDKRVAKVFGIKAGKKKICKVNFQHENDYIVAQCVCVCVCRSVLRLFLYSYYCYYRVTIIICFDFSTL